LNNSLRAEVYVSDEVNPVGSNQVWNVMLSLNKGILARKCHTGKRHLSTLS
jgi:hypothetical protein